MGNITIGIGDLKVCRAPDVLVTYALGSCVGICLLDNVTGIGGLAHIMLPESSGVSAPTSPMKFADKALPMLVQQMVSFGANRTRLTAKIAGGAMMFSIANEKFNIGERNIKAVKQFLMDNKIPILAEDCGLNYGRTQLFYPATGVMEIRAASKGTKLL